MAESNSNMQPGPRNWPAKLIPMAAGLWLLSSSLSEPFPQLGMFDGKRLLQLYLFALLPLLALFSPGLRSGIVLALGRIPGPVGVAILLFLSIGTASALRLPHPGYPLAEVGLLFLLGTSVMCIASSRGQIGLLFDRLVLCVFAVLILGVFLLELAGTAANLSLGNQYAYSESLIRFAHPRFFNHMQTWSLPLLVLLPLVFPERVWLKWLTPLLIGLHWHILLTTGARGSIISIIAAMSLVTVLAPRSSWRWLRIQLAGFVIGVMIFSAMAYSLKLLQPEQDSFVQQSLGRPIVTTSGRTRLWTLAVEDAASEPWLGVGPAMYACDYPYSIAASPHSFPLRILAEWGVLAFLILGSVVAWAVFRLLHSVRTTGSGGDGYEETAFLCLAAAVLAAMVHANVSGVMYAPASQVTGIIVVGWLWASRVLSGGPGRETAAGGAGSGHAAAGFLVPAVGLVAALWLLSFARAELETLSIRTAYAEEYGKSAPRFWRDGRACLYDFETP